MNQSKTQTNQEFKTLEKNLSQQVTDAEEVNEKPYVNSIPPQIIRQKAISYDFALKVCNQISFKKISKKKNQSSKYQITNINKKKSKINDKVKKQLIKQHLQL